MAGSDFSICNREQGNPAGIERWTSFSVFKCASAPERKVQAETEEHGQHSQLQSFILAVARVQA